MLVALLLRMQPLFSTTLMSAQLDAAGASAPRRAPPGFQQRPATATAAAPVASPPPPPPQPAAAVTAAPSSVPSNSAVPVAAASSPSGSPVSSSASVTPRQQNQHQQNHHQQQTRQQAQPGAGGGGRGGRGRGRGGAGGGGGGGRGGRGGAAAACASEHADVRDADSAAALIDEAFDESFAYGALPQRGGGRGRGNRGRGAGGGGRSERGGFTNGADGSSRGRGRGGQQHQGGRGGYAARGGAALAAVLPQPATAMTPPVAAAAAAPVSAPVPVKAAEPTSKWGMDENGVFTLLTKEPLSEMGVIRGTWQNINGWKPFAHAAAGNGSASASSSSSVDSLAAAAQAREAELAAAAEAEAARRQAEADAWFAADTSGPAKPDLFVHDPETTAFLEFIQTLLDEEVQGVTLTQQQASVLRYLVAQPDERARALLQQLQDAGVSPSTDVLQQWQSSLDDIVSAQLSVEESCREAQLTELAALQSIFGTARELTVYQTHPITLKVLVVLLAIDCNVELGFGFPPTYPEKESLIVHSFIPPPFQGLKIRRPLSGGEGSTAVASAAASSSVASSSSSPPLPEFVCIDELLQAELDRVSHSLIGEQAVYSLIETARSFMEANESLLQDSLASTSQEEQTESRVLQLDSVKIFGRGRIEKLEYESISRVQTALDIPESHARWLLKQSRWNVEECLDAQRKKGAKVHHDPGAAAATVGAGADSSSPPPPMLPVMRQASAAERDRFEALQATYAPFLADPEATLSCSACCEDFQLREVAGQICGHVLCSLCYKRMLSTHVSQGDAFLKCAGFKCGGFVEEGLIMVLLPPHEYQAYRRRLQDSFISLRGWKWCPNIRCDKVASVQSETDQYAVVSCVCREQFCFSCRREGHWPVSCQAASAYESSKLVRDMRTKVQARIGAIKPEEDEIRIEIKLCPKCRTPWERNGGCNHFHCKTCLHHFCWICLKDWAFHGVSWFQCVFSKDQEVKAERMLFGADVALRGALDQVMVFCERELVHYLSTLRAGRIQREIAAVLQMAATGATVVPPPLQVDDASFDPELPALLVFLGYPLPQLLAPLFAFLREAHSILRSAYVFLTLHYTHFDANVHVTKRSDASNHLSLALSQFEYFIDALDQTLMPIVGTPRSPRTLEQMNETVKYVRKYAKVFATTLQFFQQTELQGQDEEGNIKAFFAALDAMGGGFTGFK